MNDVLRQLGTKRENFTLLLTDAARHMSLTRKAINELYPTLMHMSLALSAVARANAEKGH